MIGAGAAGFHRGWLGGFGFLQQVGVGVDALRDGLGNDVQKQAFAARSQQLLQQFRAGVGEHVLREYQAHHDQVAEAGIAAAQRQADLNPDSEEMRGQSVQAIRGIVDNVVKRKGWAPEQRDAAVIEALSPLHMGVIAREIENQPVRLWQKNQPDIAVRSVF